MPFCNHCGEILSPGIVRCPTCRQDPVGSSTSTLRGASALHLKLERFGPAQTSAPGGGGIMPSGGEGVGQEQRTTTHQPPAHTRMQTPRFHGPGPREREPLVPGPHLQTEPVRLTVSPATPDFDPNILSESSGVTATTPGDSPGQGGVGDHAEEILEDFLQTDVSLDKTQRKVKHILSRAAEHVERGRTYRALKKKSLTRQSYQRAMRYYEQAVTLDPDNVEARRGRQECLARMSM